MKNNLSQVAKAFYVEKWGDTRIMFHSECVIEACLGMINNTLLNKEVFIIAGWIHDLGRKDNKLNHHILGLKFLDEFLVQNQEYEPLRKEIEDCIKNHRSSGDPKTIYGMVMKAADKVALKNKNWLDFEEKKV